jgi:hypothetical protein
VVRADRRKCQPISARFWPHFGPKTPVSEHFACGNLSMLFWQDAIYENFADEKANIK